MPIALFYTELIDMAQQNALLVNMRTSVSGKQQEKQNGFFLYTYGGTGTFSSESAPLKYGYSRYSSSLCRAPRGELCHTGRAKYHNTFRYCRNLRNVFYRDLLVSYGILRGNISKAIIGKTTKLKSAINKNLKTLGISGTNFSGRICYQF